MGIRRSEELVVSKFTRDDDGNPTGGVTKMHCGPSGTVLSFTPKIHVQWQDGIVGDDGQTGALVEDVIEVAVQRLEFFQKSKFNCTENEMALVKLKEALQWLDWRTRKRLIEGVENTYERHQN